MPTTQLPKQEDTMASNNDLSESVWGNETEIAQLEKKEDVSIFILSLSPLSNFRPELLLLAAQAEVSHLSAQECCKHYRNNSENDKKCLP